jgi:hypothetical protein
MNTSFKAFLVTFVLILAVACLFYYGQVDQQTTELEMLRAQNAALQTQVNILQNQNQTLTQAVQVLQAAYDRTAVQVVNSH